MNEKIYKVKKSEKIKSCPFCGNQAQWVESSSEFGDFLIKGYKLQCSRCWCSPYPNNYSGNKNEIIQLWNKRATE